MKLVHLTEMTPPQWYQVWNAMYDPVLGAHTGVDPVLLAAKPSLEGFYENVMKGHQAGVFEAWAIIKDGAYRGHTVLDKRVGEWELGTILIDPNDWSRGAGVRASLHAAKWAFEEAEAEWLLAFTQGKDPRVQEMLHRSGFRPLLHFHVMDRATWDARWRARRSDGNS